MIFRLVCETCDQSWRPEDWRTSAEHPSLGKHEVYAYEQRLKVDTEVEIRAAREWEETRNGGAKHE